MAEDYDYSDFDLIIYIKGNISDSLHEAIKEIDQALTDLAQLKSWYNVKTYNSEFKSLTSLYYKLKIIHEKINEK